MDILDDRTAPRSSNSSKASKTALIWKKVLNGGSRKGAIMNIILSIHPKWVKLIYEGKKTLEWRKNTPNADFIDKVFLYETAPVRKVTGFFMYDHYFSLVLTGEDKPRDGADVLLARGCVPLDDLKKYAGRKKEIFGWKICKVCKFDSPKSLEDFGLERPPQSWCYTEMDKNAARSSLNRTP